MEKKEVRILISDAAVEVALDLAVAIASGVMLGRDQPVIVHLLHGTSATDVAAAEELTSVPFGSPVLLDVIATSDVEKACNNVAFAILIANVPRKNKTVVSRGMVNNYKLLADALENYAAANCKVLVISYPADTLALTLKRFAPSIPPKNITILTRSYHNCALGHIAMWLKTPVCYVKNVIIWGKHSSPLHLDINHATVLGEYPVRDLINDDAWLNGTFMTYFQHRAALAVDIKEEVGRANLIAKAACDHIREWVLGTPEGRWVSMGVFSDGSYNVPAGLIYSFPVTCRNGEWTIVQGLPLDEFSRKKMDSTVEELMQEQLLIVTSIEDHVPSIERLRRG
ncbi:malate dehydrogenase-like [Rhodamnia argentea]|uniref:Malate dehydrogenase-like n=1 Tax=Rhodamnia argentea TaxID=178133 RepID=A0ABM3H3J3_9MYRT|nr:malate dehydrogenase-like [Rhodamnia argentea]